MKIGIDFDNTIACYDQVFHAVAHEQSLIDESVPIDKLSVRDNLRKNGKEEDWIKLQGFVYGCAMNRVRAYDGATNFLRWAKNKNHTCQIISHKTKHPYLGPKYDLHAAAKKWIVSYLADANGLLVSNDMIFFHQTKSEKIEQIKIQKCDLFIDDLPEILLADEFPDATRKILFDPSSHHQKKTTIESVSHWDQFKTLIS